MFSSRSRGQRERQRRILELQRRFPLIQFNGFQQKIWYSDPSIFNTGEVQCRGRQGVVCLYSAAYFWKKMFLFGYKPKSL